MYIYNVYNIFVLKRTRVDKRRNGIVCIYLYTRIYILQYLTYNINRNIYVYRNRSTHDDVFSERIDIFFAWQIINSNAE